MLRKNETSARHVHAVLAAAVDDPALLDRLRREAGPRRGRGPAADYDLERLRLFAGLTVKVRQNDVRARLPLTFKLLDRLKLSMPLFASYSGQAAALRRQGKPTPNQKIESISRFIESWLDPKDSEHALVRDVLLHERALLAPGSVTAGAPGRTLDRTPEVVPQVTFSSVPRRARDLILRETTCDLNALERMLRSHEVTLSAAPRGRFHYVYCRNANGVSARELDELGQVMILLANGRRRVARIADLLRQAGVTMTDAQACNAVEALVRAGILTLRTRSGVP